MKRKGMTIVEMLLAGALGFLALTVMVQVLVPLLRYLPLSSARAELLQAATVTSTCLSRDLERASLEGLVLTPQILSIHGVGGVTSTGIAAYSDHLVIYAWANQNLTRMETGAAIPVDRPYRPSPSELQTLLNTPNAHPLVHGLLRAFSVQIAGPYLQIDLTMETDVAGRGPETYRHTQTLALRNGDR